MTEIENEFVPYTESIELKELGFDKPCIAIYEFKKLFVGEFKNSMSFELCKKTETFPAPTFSQAFRWIREKYGLVPVIIPTVNVFWTYKVVRCLEGEVEFPPYKDVCAYDYSTYEGAELECLREMIKMVNENIDKEKS